MFKVYQVDAFAAAPFQGNPAAVCPLDAPAPDLWMQQVAMEMNLSETAFCWPEGDAFRLRWFTPVVEVDLCGHATLATAHVLARDSASFRTRSGVLTATRVDGVIELDFPALPPADAPVPDGLVEALGLTPERYLSTGKDALCIVSSEDAVRRCRPDFGRLAKVDVYGVIVSAPGGPYDFVSRYFAPGVGVDEDPVTGAAHCVLAPYWCDRLGRSELTGYQASARGGVVSVRVNGDRVGLAGTAVTVMEGRLLVPRSEPL